MDKAKFLRYQYILESKRIASGTDPALVRAADDANNAARVAATKEAAAKAAEVAVTTALNAALAEIATKDAEIARNQTKIENLEREAGGMAYDNKMNTALEEARQARTDKAAADAALATARLEKNKAENDLQAALLQKTNAEAAKTEALMALAKVREDKTIGDAAKAKALKDAATAEAAKANAERAAAKANDEKDQANAAKINAKRAAMTYKSALNLAEKKKSAAEGQLDRQISKFDDVIIDISQLSTDFASQITALEDNIQDPDTKNLLRNLRTKVSEFSRDLSRVTEGIGVETSIDNEVQQARADYKREIGQAKQESEKEMRQLRKDREDRLSVEQGQRKAEEEAKRKSAEDYKKTEEEASEIGKSVRAKVMAQEKARFEEQQAERLAEQQAEQAEQAERLRRRERVIRREVQAEYTEEEEEEDNKKEPDDRKFDVIFRGEGRTGLTVDTRFIVQEVGLQAQTLGVIPGDRVVSMEGMLVKNMDREQLKSIYSRRPLIVKLYRESGPMPALPLADEERKDGETDSDVVQRLAEMAPPSTPAQVPAPDPVPATPAPFPAPAPAPAPAPVPSDWTDAEAMETAYFTPDKGATGLRRRRGAQRGARQSITSPALTTLSNASIADEGSDATSELLKRKAKRASSVFNPSLKDSIDTSVLEGRTNMVASMVDSLDKNKVDPEEQVLEIYYAQEGDIPNADDEYYFKMYEMRRRHDPLNTESSRLVLDARQSDPTMPGTVNSVKNAEFGLMRRYCPHLSSGRYNSHRLCFKNPGDISVTIECTEELSRRIPCKIEVNLSSRTIKHRLFDYKQHTDGKSIGFFKPSKTGANALNYRPDRIWDKKRIDTWDIAERNTLRTQLEEFLSLEEAKNRKREAALAMSGTEEESLRGEPSGMDTKNTKKLIEWCKKHVNKLVSTPFEAFDTIAILNLFERGIPGNNWAPIYIEYKNSVEAMRKLASILDRTYVPLSTPSTLSTPSGRYGTDNYTQLVDRARDGTEKHAYAVHKICMAIRGMDTDKRDEIEIEAGTSIETIEKHHHWLIGVAVDFREVNRQLGNIKDDIRMNDQTGNAEIVDCSVEDFLAPGFIDKSKMAKKFKSDNIQSWVDALLEFAKEVSKESKPPTLGDENGTWWFKDIVTKVANVKQPPRPYDTPTFGATVMRVAGDALTSRNARVHLPDGWKDHLDNSAGWFGLNKDNNMESTTTFTFKIRHDMLRVYHKNILLHEISAADLEQFDTAHIFELQVEIGLGDGTKIANTNYNVKWSPFYDLDYERACKSVGGDVNAKTEDVNAYFDIDNLVSAFNQLIIPMCEEHKSLNTYATATISDEKRWGDLRSTAKNILKKQGKMRTRFKKHLRGPLYALTKEIEIKYFKFMENLQHILDLNIGFTSYMTRTGTPAQRKAHLTTIFDSLMSEEYMYFRYLRDDIMNVKTREDEPWRNMWEPPVYVYKRKLYPTDTGDNSCRVRTCILAMHTAAHILEPPPLKETWDMLKYYHLHIGVRGQYRNLNSTCGDDTKNENTSTRADHLNNSFERPNTWYDVMKNDDNTFFVSPRTFKYNKRGSTDPVPINFHTEVYLLGTIRYPSVAVYLQGGERANELENKKPNLFNNIKSHFMRAEGNGWRWMKMAPVNNWVHVKIPESLRNKTLPMQGRISYTSGDGSLDGSLKFKKQLFISNKTVQDTIHDMEDAIIEQLRSTDKIQSTQLVGTSDTWTDKDQSIARKLNQIIRDISGVARRELKSKRYPLGYVFPTPKNIENKIILMAIRINWGKFCELYQTITSDMYQYRPRPTYGNIRAIPVSPDKPDPDETESEVDE